jgi:hypothetical protein
MKKVIIVIFILLLTMPCFAWQKDPWTTSDTVLQLTAVSTIMIDAWQTWTFLHHPNFPGQSETNPFLGPHPSNKRFFSYWGICVVGHTTISYILPSPIRQFWQFFWIGAELKTIHWNYQVGVRVKI